MLVVLGGFWYMLFFKSNNELRMIPILGSLSIKCLLKEAQTVSFSLTVSYLTL